MDRSVIQRQTMLKISWKQLTAQCCIIIAGSRLFDVAVACMSCGDSGAFSESAEALSGLASPDRAFQIAIIFPLLVRRELSLRPFKHI